MRRHGALLRGLDGLLLLLSSVVFPTEGTEHTSARGRPRGYHRGAGSDAFSLDSLFCSNGHLDCDTVRACERSPDMKIPSEFFAESHLLKSPVVFGLANPNL